MEKKINQEKFFKETARRYAEAEGAEYLRESEQADSFPETVYANLDRRVYMAAALEKQKAKYNKRMVLSAIVPLAASFILFMFIYTNIPVVELTPETNKTADTGIIAAGIEQYSAALPEENGLAESGAEMGTAGGYMRIGETEGLFSGNDLYTADAVETESSAEMPAGTSAPPVPGLMAGLTTIDVNAILPVLEVNTLTEESNLQWDENIDTGSLPVFRIKEETGQPEKIGDYPVITAAQAREILANNYDESGIAGAELVYRVSNGIIMPYYLFWRELPERTAVYVPAVNAAYLSTD